MVAALHRTAEAEARKRWARALTDAELSAAAAGLPFLLAACNAEACARSGQHSTCPRAHALRLVASRAEFVAPRQDQRQKQTYLSGRSTTLLHT